MTEPCHVTMLCPYPHDHPIHAEDGDHDYDPTPRTAATARDALESITRRVRRIPAHRGWYIDHSMDLMHDEGEPCVICDALAAAEAPDRVAALEAALLDIATERDMAEAYYPTLERHLREHGCEHDFADVADANGSLATPAGRVAGHPHDGYAYDGCVCVCCVNVRALAAPAPTPSEPVERVRAEYEAWLDEAIAKAKRWRDAGTLTESEYAAAMAVLFVTDAKPTDEEMERIRAMCIERGWTAAPAPTPSDPVARCVGEHDWETRHPGDLAVCRRCWTVESDATPATRDE